MCVWVFSVAVVCVCVSVCACAGHTLHYTAVFATVKGTTAIGSSTRNDSSGSATSNCNCSRPIYKDLYSCHIPDARCSCQNLKHTNHLSKHFRSLKKLNFKCLMKAKHRSLVEEIWKMGIHWSILTSEIYRNY